MKRIFITGLIITISVFVLAACSAAPEPVAPKESPPAPAPVITPQVSSSPSTTPATSPTKTTAAPRNSRPVKPTWINANITDTSVSVKLNEIQKNIMTHFRVPTSAGTISFMAYVFGEQIQVRANICVPCRSESFSLVGNTLVCDSCGTVFEASTGKGVRGACVAFPKSAAEFGVNDNEIVIGMDKLLSAYSETLKPG